MRFGLVHRLMTDALASLGILALVLSGELHRGVAFAIVAGLVGALAMPEGWQDKAAVRYLATVGPVVLLAMQITRLVLGATTLQVAVEFAAALQIVRLATRRGAAHDQQVIVLALLHLIAGTVLGGGMGYGVCFLGFLVVAPGALVLSHLRREVEGNYRQGARDRTGLPVDVPRILRSRRVVGRGFLFATCLLSIPIFLFTAALFVLFPRVGLSFLLLNRTHAGRMIGFSDQVNLGNVGTLRSDPTIAMRVEIPELPQPPPPRLALHLRGATFDAWNGTSWTRSSASRDPMLRDTTSVWIRRRPDPGRDRSMRIELEAIDPPVLFVPPGAVAMQVRARDAEGNLGSKAVEVTTNGDGEYRYGGADDRGVRYEVWVPRQEEPSRELLGLADRDRYLALPGRLSPRIAELARTWANDARSQEPQDLAQAVLQHLRTEYAYDLSSPSATAADPLDDFLFHSRRGHCEYYSTALVVMLRSLGVPARNVTGFIGGTWNRFGGYYAVRNGDAHSWAEVFLEGRGWTTFDPTPPSDAAPRSDIGGLLPLARDVIEALSQRWDRHVVGYDMYQQWYLLDRVSESMRPLRRGASTAGGTPMPRGRALVLLVVGLGLVGAGSAWLWRLRHGGDDPETERDAPRARERAAATAFYESLESALVALGITRAAGTPPLRHAEALAESGHPLAPEVLALTRRYLDARFGAAPIGDGERRELEQRVRRLRTLRQDPAAG